jgi:S-adenosylmethionine:tRNA ribosyltransferase-isomerase
MSDADDALDLYDFDLPLERIAQRPLARRDASRLMVLAPGAPPRHRHFADLADELRPGDRLVRNDTRVIPARLMGRRPGGGKTELLLVRPEPETDGTAAPERWRCLARPASPLKPGMRLRFSGASADGPAGADGVESWGGVVEGRGDAGAVVFRFDAAGDFWALLDRYGQVPLPPYIAREGGAPDAEDAEEYQTLFARVPGAVAAPTAGRHFTPELDARLAERGVGFASLTLHVGPGTFRPVTATRLSMHVMDAEWYDLPPEAARAVDAARREGRRVVAVGTTVARALESAARRAEAEGRTTLPAGPAWTDLLIRPGHAFKAVDALVTNFHLPRSSLLALASAWAGRERILAAYREALAEGYRFYSYGDAMLLQ